MSRTPKPCPGCGRARSTCWVMPCLYLEQLRARGPAAVDRWLRVVGKTVHSPEEQRRMAARRQAPYSSGVK
jgi:hypothetical protein